MGLLERQERKWYPKMLRAAVAAARDHRSTAFGAAKALARIYPPEMICSARICERRRSKDQVHVERHEVERGSRLRAGRPPLT